MGYLKKLKLMSIAQIKAIRDKFQKELLDNLKFVLSSNKIIVDEVKQLKLNVENNQNKIERSFDKIEKRLDKNAVAIKKSVLHFDAKMEDLYSRIESLLQLICFYDGSWVLPKFTDWSIFSNTAFELIRLCRGRKSILELGSGSSTYLFGQMLRNQGEGHLISIEHDERFYKQTLESIKEDGLDEYIDLYYSPLKEMEINKERFFWYDMKNISLPVKGIDTLFVDGPPGRLCRRSRYPAFKMLKNYLTDDAYIFLHDAKREDEKEIIDLWAEESGLTVNTLKHCTKGLFLLNKQDVVGSIKSG